MFAKHSKTFYIYLFSYLSIMVLGISVIVLFVLLYLFPRFRSDLSNSHQAMLEQTAASVDNNLSMIYQTSYQLSYSSNNLLSYFIMDDTPARDLKIINELKSYSAISSFIEEIGLLKKDSDFIYTSTGVYPIELFFKNIYHYPTLENPKNLFLSFTTNASLPSSLMDSSNRYLTFINPSYALSNLKDTTILFWVEESRITSILEHISNENTITAIYNDNGEFIYSTDSSLSSEEIIAINQAITSTTQEQMNLRNNNYSIYSCHSSINNWVYVYAINNDAAFHEMNTLYFILSTVIFITVLLGVLAIGYYMRITYTPLKFLKSITDKLTPEESNDTDEMDSLRSALDYLANQDHHQVAMLRDSELYQSLHDSLLFSLLKGHVTSIEEFNHDGATVHIQLTKPNYQVLMIQFPGINKSPLTANERINSLLMQVFPTNYEFYFREFFEENQYVVILAFDDALTTTTLALCRILHEQALEHDMNITIGIGTIYQEVSGFQKSCLEAELALRNSFVCGHGSVITYAEQDLQQLVKQQLYPTECMQSIQMLIRCKDYVGFQDKTDHLFEKMIQNQLNADYAKNLCNSITNIFISELPPDDLYRNINTILLMYHADTLSSYQLYLGNLLKDLSQVEESSQKEESGDLLYRIQQYLAQNFDDCNFSAQKVADALDINSSYLSQYFKSQTNTNLNNYVATLRIEKAKRLLTSTNLSLPLISEEVGYYNQNSFIRRFKQITGMTPGDYRKSNGTRS